MLDSRDAYRNVVQHATESFHPDMNTYTVPPWKFSPNSTAVVPVDEYQSFDLFSIERRNSSTTPKVLAKYWVTARVSEFLLAFGPIWGEISTVENLQHGKRACQTNKYGPRNLGLVKKAMFVYLIVHCFSWKKKKVH